jgi:outer membrane protein assembly factor BamA
VRALGGVQSRRAPVSRIGRRHAVSPNPMKSNPRVTLISLFLVFLLCVAVSGQKAGKAKLSYKLLSIRVTGASEFKEDQVISASGLKLGQYAGESDFQQAMRRLGNTGLFTNLTYSYHYSPDGCDVEFQIAENTELVPIVFDNFVWFSDDDLISQLHGQLPLFNGRLPVAGNLADQVVDSLNAILVLRKIAGKAQYVRAGKADGPVDSYIYKINFHPVLIRNVDFPGAEPTELPALNAAAKQLSGQEYLRTKMRPQKKFNLLPVYLARGYLKASISDAQAKVAEDGPRTLVDVSFSVVPGRQYKLAGIQWQGNAVFPAEKLQELVHLKAGEPANALQLNDDIEAVKKLYGTKGYLFARVDPAPEMDEEQATVKYQLIVTEGDLYRMGDLELDGLDPDASKKMAAQWQLKKGDPYDNSYLPRFFSIMYRDIGLRRPYNVVRKESVNQQDKTVSVALHFMPKG